MKKLLDIPKIFPFVLVPKRHFLMLVPKGTTFSDFLFCMQTSKCHYMYFRSITITLFYFILFDFVKTNMLEDINHVL